MSIIVPVGEGTATFVFTCAGITKECTWSVGIRPLDEDWAPASIASTIQAFSQGSTKPYDAAHMGVAWTFQGVSCMKMTDDGPLVGDFFDPVDGTSNVGNMPINCAVLMNKRTALGGRKNKGRAYIPPCYPAETLVNGAGLVEEEALDNLTEWYEALLGSFVTEELVPCVHHSDGSAGTPINGLVPGGTIATQRRRLR